jgi:hypothetical protein
MRRRHLAALVFALMFLLVGPGRAQDEEAPAAEPAATPAPDEAEADAPAAEGEEEKTYEKPEKVTIGVFLNDIQAIDLKSHSYAMDFYVWFRWKNPDLDPASSMEIANPIEQWGLMVTPLYEEPEELEDGTFYQILRIQGTFSKKLPLYNYPFDRQTLAVIFEDAVNDTQSLVYVADSGGTQVNPTLQLPGYRVALPTLALATWHYPTAFGDPRTPADTNYSRATLEVPISRPPLAYSTKLFLPVLCVILCATLMFLLAPGLVDSRVDVGITSLLTIVALQMTYNTDLPDVGYLMLMDKVYLLAYGFVIVGLSVVVYTTRLHEAGREQLAESIHRRTLGLASLAWAVAMVVLVSEAMEAG